MQGAPVLPADRSPWSKELQAVLSGSRAREPRAVTSIDDPTIVIPSSDSQTSHSSSSSRSPTSEGQMVETNSTLIEGRVSEGSGNS